MVTMIFRLPYLSAICPPGMRVNMRITEPSEPINPIIEGDAPSSLMYKDSYGITIESANRINMELAIMISRLPCRIDNSFRNVFRKSFNVTDSDHY